MEYLEESTRVLGLKIATHGQLMVLSKLRAAIFEILIFWRFMAVKSSKNSEKRQNRPFFEGYFDTPYLRTTVLLFRCCS